MLNDHKFIVFALEHYNPLGVIRSLGCMGIRPIYISVRRRYEIAIKSKYISTLHKVDSIQEGYALLMREYGNEKIKPFLLFSDDKSEGFFDLRYNEWKDKFIGYNAGEQGRINRFIDKIEIQLCAKRNGFDVLDSFVVRKDTPLPKELWYPVITKDISPNVGNWKADVFICQTEEELLGAMERIASNEIMVQHFVDKDHERALQGYSINHGDEIHICADMITQYQIEGYYSPNHYVRNFEDDEMLAKLKSLFKELKYEGLFEVEFLVDKDGTSYFLEVNLRASCFAYAATAAGMPMPYLWAKGMISKTIDAADRKVFEPFYSMSEAIDYGKRVEGGLISFAEWLKEFKEAKCTYLYNVDDPEPFRELYTNFDKFK